MAARLPSGKQRGTVALETTLGMFFFLLILFYWCEISYMGFIAATLDYAVAEASRSARTAPSNDYLIRFKTVLKSSSPLWAAIIDTRKLSVTVHYYGNVVDLASEYCPEQSKPFCHARDNPGNASIAVYQITYPYQPFFTSLFIDKDKIPVMSREVISVQEYERSSFSG